MTHSIVVPPDLESDLNLKATRLGLPLELYVLEVLRQDVKAKMPAHKIDSRSAKFLELTAELMPVIEAGILITSGSLEPTEVIDAVRDEREAELINHN